MEVPRYWRMKDQLLNPKYWICPDPNCQELNLANRISCKKCEHLPKSTINLILTVDWCNIPIHESQ